MTGLLRVEIASGVAERVRHLPPELKRSVREAIRALVRDPALGVPLARELEGLWRYRVRRYRIAYRVDRKRRRLQVMAVGHRRDIYESLPRS